jgi:peptidoglycan/LPS O-acetylase OafA/YrhL
MRQWIDAYIRHHRVIAVTLGLGTAAFLAVLGNFVIAQIALAAGASDAFEPLTIAGFTPLTVFGVLAGAAGWAVFRRMRNGAAILRVLVPAVVAVSLIPDVMVGVSASEPGADWTGAIALMFMHAMVAIATVPVLNRVLPIKPPAAPATA